MKIKQISYRCLRTGSGYNNTAVEATAEVGEDGPEVTLAELKAWVDGQVDEQLKRHAAYEKMSEINERLGSAERELERVQKRVEAYREILKEKPKLAALAREHGLRGDALLLDNMS